MERDPCLQKSIFAGVPGTNASAAQKRTRQNVQTLYLAWKETKDTAPARVAKIREQGTWPSSVETQRLGGLAAACVGPAVAASEWRGQLGLERQQTLPDPSLGRGTDRNSLAEKAQSNPATCKYLEKGSVSLKHRGS